MASSIEPITAIPDGFFPSLMLQERSVMTLIPLKLNPRHYWAEATVFLNQKLREGVHPARVGIIVSSALTFTDLGAYDVLFLQSVMRMLSTLHQKGKLAKLPENGVYAFFSNTFTRSATRQRVAFLIDMAGRFEDVNQFSVDVLDPYVHQILYEAPELDGWCVQTLAFMVQKEQEGLREYVEGLEYEQLKLSKIPLTPVIDTHTAASLETPPSEPYSEDSMSAYDSSEKSSIDTMSSTPPNVQASCDDESDPFWSPSSAANTSAELRPFSPSMWSKNKEETLPITNCPKYDQLAGQFTSQDQGHFGIRSGNLSYSRRRQINIQVMSRVRGQSPSRMSKNQSEPMLDLMTDLAVKKCTLQSSSSVNLAEPKKVERRLFVEDMEVLASKRRQELERKWQQELERRQREAEVVHVQPRKLIVIDWDLTDL
ncbi:uncharacterized protein LY89DRAFT_667898 [Mollisia scopiformis]|uniref:Uncharacterized protein n=1 Tax=Mollisia scopiformis TaxID=149040 RepID=A0A194XFC1_MOLSC|nr:uncharacterized protein LY89DRAFT_667898 [Mollisia scopiformis]KUJ18846.1 hypothetical protein LY89DRAFT_667898 [Mollisia scopiformis]